MPSPAILVFKTNSQSKETQSLMDRFLLIQNKCNFFFSPGGYRGHVYNVGYDGIRQVANGSLSAGVIEPH